MIAVEQESFSELVDALGKMIESVGAQSDPDDAYEVRKADVVHGFAEGLLPTANYCGMISLTESSLREIVDAMGELIGMGADGGDTYQWCKELLASAG